MGYVARLAVQVGALESIQVANTIQPLFRVFICGLCASADISQGASVL